MKILVNGLLYDESNRQCLCILNQSQGLTYAFIQCLDVGMDGRETPITKRYWGQFLRDDKEASIRDIMLNGGKWPVLPE